MSSLTTTTSADDLLPEIVNAHRAVIDHFRQSVACAIKAGELLIQAKNLVRRGEWQDWLGNNCPFAETTAQGYMRLAKLPEENRNAVADLSLRAALAAIATTREKQIADESKTIDGEAEEVEISETDQEPDRIEGDDPAPEQPDRSPEEKARDIASETIHDVLQRCQWNGVDHLLAFQTLIKLLTDELKMKMTIPLSAEESAEARKASYAATEEKESPAPKKKRGRPPKVKAEPEQDPVVEMLPPDDDLSIPESLRRPPPEATAA